MTAHTNSPRQRWPLALAVVGALALAGAIVGSSWAKGGRQEAAAAARSPGVDFTTAFMLAGVLK